MAILEVKNLVTTFATEQGIVRAVDGVSFSIERGKTLGIVGESGCGKSVTSLSIMRLLPKPAGDSPEGEVIFDNDKERYDILKLSPKELRSVRGTKVSMIFQDPLTSLNPVYTIGAQLIETLKIHFPEMKKKELVDKSILLLTDVGIPSPEQRIYEYPHQLSGGMRQRVLIAIALACEPDVLIADEPTTALDVTIQAQIIKLIKDLQKQNNMGVLFITHDLGVVAEVCDDVCVMYAGRVAEKGPVHEIFQNPKHPYTKGLLNSIPKLDTIPKAPLFEISGMVPDLMSMPEGCRFQNRCNFVTEDCKQTIPTYKVAPGHTVNCIRYGEI
ncbi:MAG: ABC transporter ATP-binding protein [Lentisphaeria bacterium]|nr:ABC transporter ATP-binding protein [Lentisphaeria bacterium]